MITAFHETDLLNDTWSTLRVVMPNEKEYGLALECHETPDDAQIYDTKLPSLSLSLSTFRVQNITFGVSAPKDNL